uniref:Integrase, catalytic region, zinc finger, CCHC-type, peptidase aspartic, catalytic n=1 Tax=Tanacetum cinerariifolium TaxID=118510 RepID=A0A6L2KL14_TANCI|nr:hypothetical protein [Tanacetum cinerariifolium]
MTSLADKAILSGTDNRPPILEKDMYDSWKRRMELYMLNRQHGQMILESVESGPLLWPSIEENGLKKYSELSPTEAIQADCDVKATNIILQGLPPEVYALVSTHKVAKELWEMIQMLMQGTSLTKYAVPTGRVIVPTGSVRGGVRSKFVWSGDQGAWSKDQGGDEGACKVLGWLFEVLSELTRM